MNKQNIRKLLLTFAVFLFASSMALLQKTEVQASGSYYIQINKGTNVVTVFKNDGTPYKAFICSTGTATPIGTYYTSQKLRWHTLDGPTYGQYCTRITRGFLFHSVWYYENGNVASQSYQQYNRLGTTASHGCVRLTVADSKWIYDNCPLNTKVIIFNGSSANDPLGKPEAIKVNPNQRMGWDPTDPAAGNPYAHLFPSINTSGKKTNVQIGSNFNPLSNISATDSAGNDISGKVTYSGTVDTNKMGSYTLNYSVTDALGRTSSATLTFKVVDTKKATITGVKKTLTKEYNSTLNLLKKVKARAPGNPDLTNKIKTKIIYPGTKAEKTYRKSSLKLTKLGKYKINYYVTNPNNKKVTKVTSTVTVRDTKKPKLSGVKSTRKLEYNSRLNLRSGITSNLVSGRNMTSKIVIKIRKPKASKFTTLKASGGETVNFKKYRLNSIGTYTVEYTVTNPNNKKAVTKKTSTIIVQDTKAPVLSGVASKKTVEYNSKLNLISGITSKLVSGKSMNSGIVIKVREQGSGSFKTLKATGDVTENYKKYQFKKTGTYTVQYSVTNPNNSKAVTTKTTQITVEDTAAPVIKGVSNSLTLVKGTPYAIRSGVTANLLSGTAISNIEVLVQRPDRLTDKVTTSEYLFDQVGIYTVTYNAVNPTGGKSNTVNMSVTVDELKITFSNNKVNLVEKGTSYNVYDGVIANLASGVPLNNSEIEVSISRTGGGEIPPIDRNGSVIFVEEDTYTITYKATRGIFTTTEEFKVEVITGRQLGPGDEVGTDSNENRIEESATVLESEEESELETELPSGEEPKTELPSGEESKTELDEGLVTELPAEADIADNEVRETDTDDPALQIANE